MIVHGSEMAKQPTSLSPTAIGDDSIAEVGYTTRKLCNCSFSRTAGVTPILKV